MSGPAAPRRPDVAALVIAVGLALLAAVIFWKTRGMPVTAQYARVGPTTFPYVVATGLLLLAIGTAVSAWRGSFPEREADHVGPMLWIVGGLVAQMALLKTAGFSIATGVLFALAARGFGRGPLWMTIPMGIVFAFVVWLVFARLLQLSLPTGLLEALVP
jgi:putative tricarboxylic transport membrane protein